MTEFEFTQLMVIADSFEMTGDSGKGADVRAAYRDCAHQLRQWLRHADTIPPGAPAITTPAPPPESS